MEDARLYVSRFPTGHHAMVVVNRWNRNNTDRRSILDEPGW
jgi:hypothetical protein